MGGGGAYYDRDTRDGYDRGSRGFSNDAEEKMSRRSCDPGLLPKDRRLVCASRSPVVYGFDVTGSMGNLPRIIYDKMPLIAGQLVECGYLRDAAISLAAIGDVRSDKAPIQIAEFSPVRKLDDWLQRVWLEGNGGGNGGESYEFTAYFYARMCDLSKAVTPFFLITGDEHFRETLYARDLQMHFGGRHKDVETKEVFAELMKKFKGNVFLIHRRYSDPDDEKRIAAQWRELLGPERVIMLGSDTAIADVTLGVFALMTASRTLDEFLRDLKTKRDVPQTDQRVAEVRKALQQLTAIAPKAPLLPPTEEPEEKKPAPKARTATRTSGAKTAAKPGGRKKPGRY